MQQKQDQTRQEFRHSMKQGLKGLHQDAKSTTDTSGGATTDQHMTEKHISKRSASYLEALRQLDEGDWQSALQVIQQEVASEVASSRRELIGIIARCYLGAPHDVHMLDVGNQILRHFPKTEPLPSGLEPARPFALKPQFCAVEVYTDGVIAIRVTGETVEIEMDDE